MIELRPEVKEIIEKHIVMIENNEWDSFFETIQNDWIPQTVGKVAETIESAGIFPLSSMTFIPEGYFTLSNISEYNIPKNITRICYKSFYASDIERIHIPSNVFDIGQLAFEGCDFLTTFICEEGLEYLSDSAFYACDELLHVILPKSLKVLGHNVFNSCSKLVEINYKGTRNDWKTVKNHEFINEGSYISKVICADGVINL